MEQPQFVDEMLRLPTPAQLQKLSAVALAAANQANRLRRYDDRLEPVYGWVEQYHHDEGDDARYYERYSGRRARRVFASTDQQSQLEDVAFYADRWSLRYREVRQQHVGGDFWLGELKTYAFEWDQEDVLLSQCHTREIPSVESSEIERIMLLDDPDIDKLRFTTTGLSVSVVGDQELAQLTSSIRRRYASMAQRETRADVRRRKVLNKLAGRKRSIVDESSTEDGELSRAEGIEEL